MAVVVITGCSSGFGLESSLAFARHGDRVYATMRDPAGAGRLRAQAEAEGLEVEILALDVTEDESVQRAVGRVLGAEGCVDVVVNNAGVAHFGSVELMPDELVCTTFETNLFGVIRLVRAVLPGMRARRHGVIINVSSVLGRLPGAPILGAYAASKHALGALCDSLAFEVASFGIRVVSIEPGFFGTRILDRAIRPAPGSAYENLETAYLALLERGMAGAGDPRMVAGAIVRAANDPATPVHVVVGKDAEASVKKAATTTGAEWAALLRGWLSLPAP